MHFAEKCIFFCIFLYKNLHISKICCNFAPSFKKESTRTPKRNPKTNKIMYTKIQETKTEKRIVELGKYEDTNIFPYIVKYWSRKTAHMYANSFNTYKEAKKEFERIINKK